jgi:hypothetical protein
MLAMAYSVAGLTAPGGAALTVQPAWKAFLRSKVVPSASGLLSVQVKIISALIVRQRR